MFNVEENKQINAWKVKEISKINESNLPDEAKKNRIELIESTEFHSMTDLKVKEVSPHHFEANL